MKTIENIDAKALTTMHTGGTVARLFEPESVAELARLLDEHEQCIILGAGANTIFGDSLQSTPVIRLDEPFAELHIDGTTLFAGAAVRLGTLLNFCAAQGLSGMEFLAGIPGTVGGALHMNAGTAAGCICDRLVSLDLVDREGLQCVDREDLPASYRNGGIPEGAVITEARFRLEQSTPEQVIRNIGECRSRRCGQPRGYNSGCIFKNPADASAGALIDQAGLKGEHVGDAYIAYEHANFIVNRGTAHTADIVALINRIKDTVKTRFGVELTEEVRIIG